MRPLSAFPSSKRDSEAERRRGAREKGCKMLIKGKGLEESSLFLAAAFSPQRRVGRA